MEKSTVEELKASSLSTIIAWHEELIKDRSDETKKIIDYAARRLIDQVLEVKPVLG